jgi:hypothetical protein
MSVDEYSWLNRYLGEVMLLFTMCCNFMDKQVIVSGTLTSILFIPFTADHQFINRDYWFINRDNWFINRNNCFINTNNGFIDRDNRFINRDNLLINRDNWFINRDNWFINRDKSLFMNWWSLFMNQLPLYMNQLSLWICNVCLWIGYLYLWMNHLSRWWIKHVKYIFRTIPMSVDEYSWFYKLWIRAKQVSVRWPYAQMLRTKKGCAVKGMNSILVNVPLTITCYSYPSQVDM